MPEKGPYQQYSRPATILHSTTMVVKHNQKGCETPTCRVLYSTTRVVKHIPAEYTVSTRVVKLLHFCEKIHTGKLCIFCMASLLFGCFCMHHSQRFFQNLYGVTLIQPSLLLGSPEYYRSMKFNIFQRRYSTNTADPQKFFHPFSASGPIYRAQAHDMF